MKKTFTFSVIAAFLTALFGFSSLASAMASKAYWTGSNSTLWSDGKNWAWDAGGDPRNLPPSWTDEVVFSATNSSNSSATVLGGNMDIDSLTINSSVPVGIDGGGGNLQIYSGSITTNSAAGNVLINAPLIIPGAATFAIENQNTTIASLTALYSMIKQGNGVLNLSGPSTINGTTTVSAGTLNVNGSTSASSSFTVASGATLGGNGTISGAVSIASGGTLAPGNSPGVIGTGDLSLAAGSVLSAEIIGSGAVAGTDYDQVNVTGTISLLGNLTLTLTSYMPTEGQLIFLINNDLSDTITTGFANVNGGSLSNNTEFNLAGERWFISYEANYNGGTGSTFMGGNDVALYAIPEPGTWALLAFSLATIIVLRRRRAHS
jgi:autotransporter-associated beta strand protein